MLAILRASIDNENFLSAFYRTKDNFSDSSEFLYAIDILFILGALDVDFDKGMINYVKSNSL